jgi:hypothetical protein
MKGRDILKRLGFAPSRGVTKPSHNIPSYRRWRKKRQAVVRASQRRNKGYKRSRRARIGARHLA